MRKITLLILSTLLLTTFCWQANAQTYTQTTPFTIGTGAGATYTSTLNVPDGLLITDLNVDLDIAHTYVSDLTISLTSPNGTNITLYEWATGFCGQNNLDIVLDDAAAGAVASTVCNSSTNTSNPPTTWTAQGTFKPFSALSAFNGENVNGTWTLTVVDDGFGDGGAVNNWSLIVTGTPLAGDPPVIACPADIMANNVPGTCGAVANFAGIAIDTEDGNISSSIVATPPSGSTFPVGDTTVTLSVTDSDNNTSTCDFTVTVLDNELPVVACQNLTVDLDPVTGMAVVAAADVDNGSMDNCGIDTMVLDISTFDCSMVGDNTVTLTVTDESGNEASCTATITVQDVTAPEVFCIGGFGVFTESEDFEAATMPAGWSTDIAVGTYDWTFGSGDMPLGNDFPTNAAIFDDDAAGLGEVNVASLLSPVYDISAASVATVSFDYIFKDFIDNGIFTVEVFDGTAWQQILEEDDVDVGPVNTGDLDMMPYANANFQVRFTYDDEGSWAYGAGIDNFILNYEMSTGGGLDVFLDATGMASVDPMALLTGVNEACGYTVTAGGGSGTTGSLTTLFTSNNGGSANWTVMYDLTVGPNDIEITSFDINTDATGAFNMDVYTLAGTYVGNETNAGAWGTPVASGTGTGAGADVPSNAVLDSPITLTANTTYGIAIIVDAAVNYTDGTGCPGNQCYDNDDLSLSLGTAVAGIFTGSVFSPRIWNGTINYTVNAGPDIDFTCADLGENQIEITVTDDSGNTSTCIATVNVIDNTAPIITCGPAPTITETVTANPNTAIPDGDPTGLTVTLSVTEDVVMTDLNVNLDITHTWVGDITATITSPSGTSVTIVDRPGYAGSGFGCSGNDILATLDDDGTGPVESQCGSGVPSINGTFIPNNPLSVFNGESTLGDWTLTISDAATPDPGTLNSWGISYAYANTNTDVVIELGPDGTATIDPYDIISSVDEACGITTTAVDVSEVSCADIGTTIPVTVFVSDASGNIASCSANIVVVDNLGPEITCPEDQTVDPGIGNLFYILPDYFANGEATAMDNCTDPVTILGQNPAVGTPLPDGIHTITMTAEDEYGNVSTCTFELTVESVLGTDSNSFDAGIALYPNPANSVVNLVNSTNIGLERMMIYDINGKLVSQVDLRAMQSQKTVDISSLASGVYMVQINGESASTVKRLIKE